MIIENLNLNPTIMNDFITTLFTSMLLLGITQILWALIHMENTQYEAIRRHFGNYFIGVGIYIILLIGLAVLASYDRRLDALAYSHFFGSALGLALYHLGIVAASLWFKFRPMNSEPQADLEGVC
jgi:hypothetical protein